MILLFFALLSLTAMSIGLFGLIFLWLRVRAEKDVDMAELEQMIMSELRWLRRANGGVGDAH